MAEDKTNDVNDGQSRGGGMMTKLAVTGVVGIVILAETAVAFILTPSPQDVAQRMKEELREDYLATVEDPDLLQESETGPLAEVELGDFNITIHHQASESTYSISCKVMATVAESDQAEFDELKELNQFRLREKIMVEFRNANIDDLADSELGLIKRRILEKSNALFGKPLIKSVLLPDFNYYQQ